MTMIDRDSNYVSSVTHRKPSIVDHIFIFETITTHEPACEDIYALGYRRTSIRSDDCTHGRTRRRQPCLGEFEHISQRFDCRVKFKISNEYFVVQLKTHSHRNNMCVCVCVSALWCTYTNHWLTSNSFTLWVMRREEKGTHWYRSIHSNTDE
jgi:hypothetical protein